MPTPNELTYLRFYFSDEDDDELTPASLSAVVREIEKCFEAFAATFMEESSPGGKAAMYLVASPNAGSIEFTFRVSIDCWLDLKEFGWAFPNSAAASAVQIASLYVSMGSLLWSILFAGEGLLRRRKRPPSPTQRSVVPETFPGLVIALQANGKSIFWDELLTAARQSGASRVEIQLVDQPAVPIVSEDDTQPVRRVAARRNSSKMFEGRLTNFRSIKEFRNGRAYLGEVDGDTIIAVWKARVQPPEDGSGTSVKGKWMSLNQVRVFMSKEDGLPEEAATAKGVLEVEAAEGWG